MASRPAASSLGWRLFAPLSMLIGLGSLAAMCLAWTPFALVGQWLLPQRLSLRIGRYAIYRSFRTYTWILQHLCGCRFDLKELEALSASPDSMVIVANHPSLIDAVLIVSRIPNAVCIMKGAVTRNILLGAGARMAGYIANDSALNVVRRGVETLKAQPTKLVIFPEGSRTASGLLDTCQSTAGVIAARAQVPVAVMTITMSSPYLGKKWSLFRPPTLPLTIRVQEVARITVDKQSAHSFGDDIAQRLRTALAQQDAGSGQAD